MPAGAWQDWACIGANPAVDERFGRLGWDYPGNAYRIRCAECRIRIVRRELDELQHDFNVVLSEVWRIRTLLYYEDWYTDHDARAYCAALLHDIATNYDWSWQ